MYIHEKLYHKENTEVGKGGRDIRVRVRVRWSVFFPRTLEDAFFCKRLPGSSTNQAFKYQGTDYKRDPKKRLVCLCLVLGTCTQLQVHAILPRAKNWGLKKGPLVLTSSCCIEFGWDTDKLRPSLTIYHTSQHPMVRSSRTLGSGTHDDAT